MMRSLSLNSWELWSKLVCVQLLLMLHSTQAAARMLPQRRLQPLFEGNTTTPRHAPPVQSFLLSDNTWVDCIPIESQISAHHPALRNHTILTTPLPWRRRRSGKGLEDRHPQRFAREVPAGCPEGGIPVQRRGPARPRVRKVSPQGADTIHHTETHEYALTGLPVSPELAYTGVFSILSVNAPALGRPDTDFSLSQLWLMDGSYNESTLSTIEVGWQTFPYLHRKRGHERPLVPHLFVYWTTDAYRSTGCYNLECPGFVQYSNRWVIGGAMPAYDTGSDDEPAPEVAVEVILDRSFMAWWLLLDDDPVGYWPTSIFNGDQLGLRGAPRVDWGGEIIYYRSAAGSEPGNHSRTAMGSGAFPGAGYPAAAYHRNISFEDPVASGKFLSPTPLELEARRYVDDALCYDIGVQEGNLSHWGTYFFFGGSGGNNPGCVGRLNP